MSGLLARFKPAPGREARCSSGCGRTSWPSLPQRPGLGSVHVLRAAIAPRR